MGIIARQSIKASLVGFIGVAIGAVLKLFLFTKFLTSEQVGLLETLINMGVLFSPFMILGGSIVVLKYYNKIKNDIDDGGLVFSYFIVLLISILISGSLYLLFINNVVSTFYVKSPEIKQYLYVPLFIAISVVLFDYVRAISIVNHRITVPNIFSSLLNRFTVLILIIIFGFQAVLNLNFSFSQFIYNYVFLFYIVPAVGLFFYVFKFLKPKLISIKFNEMKNIFKQTYKYNLFLIFASFSDIIIQAIDISMISGNLGLSFSGVYTIAFYIGVVIDIPRRNLSNISFTIMNEAYLKNDMDKVQRIYIKSSLNQFLIGAFLFTVIWINIDNIFAIIPNGTVYLDGKYVVLFIGLAKLVDMVTGLNKQIIEISNYYKYNFFSNILLSVLLIGLNIVFINLDSKYFGGINGIAFATLLSVILHNSLLLLIVWKKDKLFPLTWTLLKVFIPFLILMLINYLLPVMNPMLSIVIKGTLSVIVFILSTSIFKISDDFIVILDKFLQKIKFIFKK